MTDVHYLFAVLLGVYGLESLAWINIRAAVFRGRRTGGFRWSFATPFLGRQELGWAFKPLLHQLGVLTTARFWPFEMSRDGISLGSIESFDGNAPSNRGMDVISWDAVRSIEALDKKLRINGGTVAVADSEAAAVHWAAVLKQVHKARPEKREAGIRESMAAAFDAEKVKARWTEFLAAASTLVQTSTALMLFVFVVAPWVIYRVGLSQCWWALLAGMLIAVIAVDVCFVAAHRKLQPSLVAERRLHMLILLINPVGAMRAGDLLARSVFGEFHPLAVARTLCGPDAFKTFARQVMLDACFPLPTQCHSNGADKIALSDAEGQCRDNSIGARTWFEGELLQAKQTLLHSAGLSIEELLAPDPKESPEARSFCPRCRRQYEATTGQCELCHNMALHTW